MNEVILTEDNINIENMIYEVRGKQVMLDSDLARLYKCKNGTKSINLAVNRNIDRFPMDFYFQLINEKIIMAELENYHMYLLNKVLLCLQRCLKHQLLLK